MLPPKPWRLRTKTLVAREMPLVMGVINVTPDSFSDGGQFLDPAAAVEHGMRLAAEGANLLDIGGQSTRPAANPVSVDEELRRVMPVVTALCRQTTVPVSIDTSSAAVAREALAAGAEAINDVTGLLGDPEMPAVAVDSGCGACIMHMQGTPRTMQWNPTYGDVVAEVSAWLAVRRDALVAAGIAADQIALDPGIGFGKTVEHNVALLRNLHRLRELACPVLVGVSRKAFIGHLIGDLGANRTAGTIGAVLAAAARGVEIVRVHDVAAVRQALTVFGAVR